MPVSEAENSVELSKEGNTDPNLQGNGLLWACWMRQGLGDEVGTYSCPITVEEATGDVLPKKL